MMPHGGIVGATLTPDQVPVLQKKLAQIILASACNGKRDVEQLKEIALRGVSGQSPRFHIGPACLLHSKSGLRTQAMSSHRLADIDAGSVRLRVGPPCGNFG